MGKIFYLMGKSASGKDSIYKQLRSLCPELKSIVLYTTRPMRDGEQEGVEYHFIGQKQLKKLEQSGKVVEVRTYQTVFGPWSYATVDDGQINLAQADYLVIGTLDSYEKLREYYGKEKLVPLYVTVDDGVRLERLLPENDSSRSRNIRNCADVFLQMRRIFHRNVWRSWM